MVSHKKINSLKVGTNTKPNLEYLQTLTADFFADRKNEELLDAWNHLQKTPGKTRIFTFATKRCPELIAMHLQENYPFNRHPNESGEYVWDIRPTPPFYAYIKHDKDSTGKVDPSDPESGIHYHFYLEYQNARTYASVATELGIPVTMLQGIKVSKKAILQYLTHENDPKKHHYSPSEIQSNFDVVQEREIDQFDSMQLFDDYYNMRQGFMTYKDFIQKYQVYIVRHSFSQQIKMAETIYNAASDIDRRRDVMI